MIPSPTPFAARSGGDQQKSLLVHSVHLPQRSTHAPSSLSPSSSVWDPDYGRINAVIVTQSVVGGLGVLLCLLSLVHIYGHSRDKRSISARLVLGMLISNLVSEPSIKTVVSVFKGLFPIICEGTAFVNSNEAFTGG